MKTIYFDTETSGLDCRNCKIIELAMLIDEDGQITEYDEFVDIGEPLHPKITRITGITNSMLANDGEKEENVAWDLKDNMTPGTLMIAHNCQFDLLFVYHFVRKK